MDNFNKIVSFVLGLVVVIVFLAIITGKFNPRKGIQSLTLKGKLTPTPTLSVKSYLSPSPTPASFALNQTNTNTYNRTNSVSTKTPTSIPATGSPTMLIPTLFSTLSLGIFLKKKNK